MSFLETADLASAFSFRSRVKVAAVSAAGACLNSEQGSATEVEYDKNCALAVEVLRDPDAAVARFVWPVLADPTIAEAGISVTDEQLLAQINAVWSSIAGVTRVDKIAPPAPPAEITG